jgi:hypothetical protein
LRRVAVARLARFARRALGRIAADLRLQLYDVEDVTGRRLTGPKRCSYLFEVSADRKRIVRCAHISAIGGDSDNPDGGAKRFEIDARQAVEGFLAFERQGK